MNIIDTLTLALAAFFTARGFIKGLINELFSLLAIGMATAFVYLFGKDVNYWLIDKCNLNESFENILYLSQFVIFVVLIKQIGKLSTTSIKQLSLGPINRLFGGFFGLIKALLIVLLAFFILEKVSEYEPNFLPNVVSDSQAFKLFKSLIYP